MRGPDGAAATEAVSAGGSSVGTFACGAGQSSARARHPATANANNFAMPPIWMPAVTERAPNRAADAHAAALLRRQQRIRGSASPRSRAREPPIGRAAAPRQAGRSPGDLRLAEAVRPPSGMNGGPPGPGRNEKGEEGDPPVGGSPPPGSAPGAAARAGSSNPGRAGSPSTGGSRSRTPASTRSSGPVSAMAVFIGLVESNAPAPRPPGERSANRLSGSVSAAIKAPRTPALPLAGWPRSATATKNRPTRNGSSRSVRFHRGPRFTGGRGAGDG